MKTDKETDVDEIINDFYDSYAEKRKREWIKPWGDKLGLNSPYNYSPIGVGFRKYNHVNINGKLCYSLNFYQHEDIWRYQCQNSDKNNALFMNVNIRYQDERFMATSGTRLEHVTRNGWKIISEHMSCPSMRFYGSDGPFVYLKFDSNTYCGFGCGMFTTPKEAEIVYLSMQEAFEWWSEDWIGFK